MPIPRFSLAISALAAMAASVGCTSLLGDFSTGPADDGGGSGDGMSSSGGSPMDAPVNAPDGADATMPPGEGGPGDAGAEGEAGPPLQMLTCNAWERTTPTLLMKVYPPEGGTSSGGGNNGTPYGNLTLYHLPGANAARVLVETDTSSGAVLLTVPDQNGGNPASVALPGYNLQAVQKLPSSLVFLAQTSSNSNFGYYSVADSDPGTSASGVLGPQSMAPDPPGLGSGGGNEGFQFISLSGGSTFYALASYQSGTTYQTAAWLPGTSIWNTVITGSAGFFQMNGSLLQDGQDATKVFGFYAPPGTSGGAPSAINQYTFPTDQPLGPASRSILGSPSETAATAAVAPGPGGSYSLAFIELSGAQSAMVKVGNVAEANINTFTLDDLAALPFDVQSDAGFFDTTPFGGGSGPGSRWLSNGDFAALGTGGTGNGAGYTGLNFYVGTPTGQWVIETAGTGKNILAGQSILGSAFDLSQAVNDILLQFDLAWIVQESDGGYALYFNVLDCML